MFDRDRWRQSLRALRRQPALVLATVAVLTLGLGLAIAVATVVNAVVLKPLPYPDADRLVHVHRDQPPVRGGPISRPDYLDLEASSDASMRFAGFHWDVQTLLGDGRAERVAAARVSGEFFALLGVPALHGRYLGPADEAPDAAPVVVVGEALWRRRWGADPTLVGRSVRLGGDVQATVVGIAPAALAFPGRTELWLPARYALDTAARGSNYVQVIARLGEGTSLDAAGARAAAVAERLARDYPENYTGLTLPVRPVLEWQVGAVRGQLGLVAGAVALVLLVVCANVANLLLARNLARAQELATRAAVGAGRGDLIGEVLRESLLLAAAGGVLGLGLAALLLDPLLALAPSALPRVDAVHIDPAVAAFALGLTLLCGLACGVLPALLQRDALAQTLRQGGRGLAGGRDRWRRALVVGELALAVVLAVGASLLDASLRRLAAVDPGIRAEGVTSARLVLPEPIPDNWRETTPPPAVQANARFIDTVLERLRALPGVTDAAIADLLPLSGTSTVSGGVRVEGREYAHGEAPTVEFRWVTPGLFATLGIPLERGSPLPATPAPGPVPVLVNRAFAELFFPGEDPVGRRVLALGDEPRVIVGVVGDTRQWSLDRAAAPELYVAWGSLPFHPQTASLAVRSTLAPSALGPAIERAVAAVDPDVPVYQLQPLTAQLAASYARRDFLRTLLLAFAAAAALVAAIGLYAVMGFDVAQRRSEIGVRLALGAAPAHVLRATVRRGLALAATGVATGAVLALAVSQLLASQLFEVAPTAPAAYAGAALAVLLLAGVASLLPARRAARVSPMQALRHA